MAINTFPNDCSIPVSALSFDYGTQRIGVAFGQSISATARPITILKAIDGIPNWNSIKKLIEEWQPDLFIVGMPYHVDGTDSEFLPRAIKFANRLNGRFNLPTFGMDERLSSKAAIEKVSDTNSGVRKLLEIDGIAAQIILENWFNGYKEKSSA
jgi:putative Holliday junction resolvase